MNDCRTFVTKFGEFQTLEGATEHSQLYGRDEPDQHPISAIAGLTEKLEQMKQDTADAVTEANRYTDDAISKLPGSVESVNGKTGKVVLKAEDVGAEEWATLKESESVPEITDEPTFRTYFYNLRKSPQRRYQFEISQGGIHENIVTGVGGRPQGADPRDSAFIYVDLPYSEAGGYIIHVTYELRSKRGLWEKLIYATLDSRWQDTGWIAVEDRTPLVVTVDKEGGGGYVADYGSSDILAAAQAHRAVIMRYTDTDTGLQTDVLLKGQSGGLPLFYDTWLSKDGSSINRLDATVDYNANVTVNIKTVKLA